MNLAESADLIGAIVGFALTIMIFSYLFGDNALFRVAIHIFIGAAAAYATMVVVYNIFWYQLIVPLLLSPLEQILVVEKNLGQYIHEVRRVLYKQKVDFYGKMSGQLISPREIIKEVLGG